MPNVTSKQLTPIAELELMAALHAPQHVPGALEAIRLRNDASSTRVIALDDDPTGSQTVHDIPVVTLRNSPEEVAAAAVEPNPAVFVLTNSRALDSDHAALLTGALTNAILSRASRRLDVRLVSRSDSTLRGHFAAETSAALETALSVGCPFDGILLCPAFPEAGRFTIGDVQWVRQGETLIPAAGTDYARDPAFGYSEATLPHWVAERTGCDPAEVASISIEDLREGGVGHVAVKLRAVTGGQVVVANAADTSDLEVLCLALQRAEGAGKRFLYRTGPSFVRVRAGISRRAPLTTADIYPSGVPDEPGLIVVGSHVPLTTRQLSTALIRNRLNYVEIDTTALAMEGDAAAAESQRCAGELAAALASGDAILATSRTLIADSSDDSNLSFARRIAAGVSGTVAMALADCGGRTLRYLVSKGGITSADIATSALRMRRATIAGQLGVGQISVWLPADGLMPGIPYVVFPGNVGTDSTLADILGTLSGAPRHAARPTGEDVL